MENKDQPAFPCLDANYHENGNTQLELLYNGISKREYFAAMAMQGLLSRTHGGIPELGVSESKRISEESVIMADELLKQLNQ